MRATHAGLLLGDSSSHPTSVELPSGYAERDDVRARLDGSLRKLGIQPVRVVEVVLEGALAQVRTLHELPRVRTRDLEALVADQLTKFFRDVPAEPVSGAIWLDARRESARAVMADLAVLECIEQAFSALGSRVRHFVVPGADAANGLVLFTPAARRRRRNRLIRTAVAWLGLAASGWLTAAVTYVVDLWADDRALGAELARLEDPLSRLEAVGDRIADFGPIAAAAQRQVFAPDGWASDKVRGLSSVLPSSTHLHALSLERAGRFVLSVHGPDPLGTVRRLEEWFPGAVRIESVPVQDPSSGPDHQSFSVVLEELDR